MINTLISIGSYAFQVAGAIILLLWSFKNCDEKIRNMAASDESQWGCFDATGVYDVLDKEKLQESARTLYKNITAFINLVIGYGLAIFMEDVAVSGIWMLTYVVLAVIVILFVESIIISIIAIKNYPESIKNYSNKN